MIGEMIDIQPLRQRGALCTSKKGFKERKKSTIFSRKTTQKRSCFEKQLPRQPFTHLLSQQNFETIPRRSGSFRSKSLRQIFGRKQEKNEKKRNPWGGLLLSLQLPSGHAVFSATAARSSEGSIWLVARRLGGTPAVVPSCPGGAAKCHRLSRQSQSLDLAAALRPLLFLCRRRVEGERKGARKMFTSYRSGLLSTEDRQIKVPLQEERWSRGIDWKLFVQPSSTAALSPGPYQAASVNVLRINAPGLPNCCSTLRQSPAERLKTQFIFWYHQSVSCKSAIFTICRPLLKGALCRFSARMCNETRSGMCSYIWNPGQWGKKAGKSVLLLNLDRINIQLPECIGTVASQSYSHWLAAGTGTGTQMQKHQNHNQHGFKRLESCKNK